MKNRFLWLLGQIRWFIIRVIHKLSGAYIIDTTHYGKYPLQSVEQGNEAIYNRLMSSEPLAVCRFSFVEMNLMIRCKTEELWGIKTYLFCKNKWKTFRIPGEGETSGLKKFNLIMTEAIKSADILGCWSNLPMGDVFINMLPDMDQKCLIDAIAIEPYASAKPWSLALKGKKVLVVSPFAELIKKQYNEKREFIWDNKDILPEFFIEGMESVWWFSEYEDPRFTSWFEAYEFMYDEIMKYDFDVALLGCGMFGFPLTARIKQAGKQAVHVGGALQILFGIKGKRWDNSDIGKYYNQYWVRPSEESKPIGTKVLDNSCYW